MVSYDEAYTKTLDYFSNDELAAKVWVDKYALRDKDNNIVETTPTDMHWRIANELHRLEHDKYDSRKSEIQSVEDFKEDPNRPMSKDFIFSLLDRYKYIVPQGSGLAGIGDHSRYVSLSNCFVVPPPHDSYGGILTTDEHIVQISKRRGGIGYDISTLRPNNMIVNNCARTTSGAVSFMHRFSNTGREVGQNNRRAAQMITMSVHHPDILNFINLKKNKESVTGANISVRLTNEFLEAVAKNTKYEQRWPEVNPKVTQQVSAREVWNEIIQAAWECAEPGLLFWDNILVESPADCYEDYKTTSTNPCSELPLSNCDSCRLLLLNLFSYVVNPFTPAAYFDYELLYLHSQIAQRFMDHIVDMELESVGRIIEKIKADPEPEEIKAKELALWKQIYEACANGRRTGTGITGLGDTLAALGIQYANKESIKVGEKIYQTVKFGCYRSSVDMAAVIGPFTVWNKRNEKDNPFLNRFKDEELDLGDVLIKGADIYKDMQKHGRRNIALLTIAPTGTVSTQTQTTSGIEPAFMLKYTRRKKINHDDKKSRVDFVDDVGDKWQEFDVYHHKFAMWMEVTGLQDVAESPYFDACAEELDWVNRVKLQGAIQKHCDHAISSTLNLPEDVAVEEVGKIYETAWKEGLKGVTVYRSGCRTGVLVEKKDKICKTEAPTRPDVLPCEVHHINVKGEPYFVMVGLLEDEPYEVFAGRNNCIPPTVHKGQIVKTKRPKGYKAELEEEHVIQPITMACNDNEEALTRLISTSLRHGADIAFIQTQLNKTSGEMTSFAKAIARSLKRYIKDGTHVGEKCPSCGGKLVFQEGCVKCQNCSMSKC